MSSIINKILISLRTKVFNPSRLASQLARMDRASQLQFLRAYLSQLTAEELSHIKFQVIAYQILKNKPNNNESKVK